MRIRQGPICVLLSSGLDSALLVHRLLAVHGRVLPLYVRCGFLWETAELYWVKRFLRAVRRPNLRALQVIDLPLRQVYGIHWSVAGGSVPGARSADAAVYLPGRNVLLLSLAAIVASQRRISTIALGVLKGNPFGDATPRFFSHMSRALTHALHRPIHILAPLRRHAKAQLIRQAAGAPLGLTFSCLQPRAGYRHCGRCNKCAERRRAFRAAGVADPTRYA